ncbi:hypothetical protein CR513_30156, partial [Mucuna pruriens]
MKRMSLENFFPASRTTSIRKEICSIRQHNRETLYEYWKWFNKLLILMDISMIDVASGRVLMNKTQLVIGQHHTNPLTTIWGACAYAKHSVDASPTLQETDPNSAKGNTRIKDTHQSSPSIRHLHVDNSPRSLCNKFLGGFGQEDDHE